MVSWRAKLSLIDDWIDYFLPREVMGPVILVFSLENVVDILFEMYLPFQSDLIGWAFILIVSIIGIGFWGEVDDDMEEFEDEIEEKIEELEERENS